MRSSSKVSIPPSQKLLALQFIYFYCNRAMRQRQHHPPLKIISNIRYKIQQQNNCHINLATTHVLYSSPNCRNNYLQLIKHRPSECEKINLARKKAVACFCRSSHAINLLSRPRYKHLLLALQQLGSDWCVCFGLFLEIIYIRIY